MKILQRLSLLALCVMPAPLFAASFNLGSDTYFSLREESLAGSEKRKIAPLTEYLKVNLDGLAAGPGTLSFHFYGFEQVNLPVNSGDRWSDDNEITYGYMNYRLKQANAQITAGRFYVFEGVANEQLDGVGARTDFGAGFAASFFGGAPVKHTGDNKGSSIVGGRLNYRDAGYFEIGLSALRESGINNSWEESMDNKSAGYRSLVGGDIYFRPFDPVQLIGHSNYNAATSHFAEHSYLLTLRPVKGLSIQGEFNNFSFKDYFSGTNVPFIFPPDYELGKMDSYGGSIIYLYRPFEVRFDLKSYKRDTMDRALKFGPSLRIAGTDDRYITGIAVSRADAKDYADSYTEIYAYQTLRNNRASGSLSGIVDVYDDAISKRKSTYTLRGTASFRISKNIDLGGVLSYSRTREYNSEVSGLVRLSVTLAAASKGAAK